MPATLRKTPHKSTTVRPKICPLKRSVRRFHDETRIATARKGQETLAVRPTVVPTRTDRTRISSKKVESLVATIFAAIVACYAAAVIIRVFSAYGA